MVYLPDIWFLYNNGSKARFFKPFGKMSVYLHCLLAQPCKVMTVVKTVFFKKKIALESFFYALLTVKRGSVVAPFVALEIFCRKQIQVGVIKPVKISSAVAVAVSSTHKAQLPNYLFSMRRCRFRF